MTWIAPLVWILVAQGAVTPLSGTVVGPGGEPVVGAELVLMGLPSYAPPIVARGTSGEGGRFTLDRPAGLAGDHHPHHAVILWAVKPGFRLSHTRFPESLPGPDEPVRIVLEPPGEAKVRVEGPDGRPVAGAVVLPERLRTEFTVIPDEIAEKTAATTGDDGVAVVAAVARDDLAYVDIRTDEFGVQGWTIAPPSDAPVVVALRPVSTWRGRLAAENPAHVKGWKVRAWARIGMNGPYDAPQAVGYVETITDDAGRFALAPIAVGSLQLSLTPPGDLPVLADVPSGLSVRQGLEGTGDIPLQKPVVITGRILERGTGEPVPDARVSIADIGPGRNQNPQSRTDADGRYTLRALPGKLRVIFTTLPPSHVAAPGSNSEDIEPAEGAEPIELATREVLAAAPPLHGEVRDENGRRVAGANVQAQWRTEIAGAATGGRIDTTTDDDGGFVLTGLGPDAALTITATFRDRRTQPPFETRSDVETPVTLVITPMPVLSAVGKLTTTAGKSLAGIPIRIEFHATGDAARNLPAGFGTLAYPGQLRTGPDGAFETPREIERKPGEFRASVNAPGFLPASGDWVPTPDGDLLRLPDLSLTPVRGLRVVTGRVVDREGNPIAGAAVSQAGDGPARTFAATEADGRFRLAGVSEGAALVFAEAEGFRFGGAIVDGNEPVEIRLARENEPPLTAWKPLSSPLNRNEERATAQEYLQPLMGSSYTASAGVDAGAATLALARVDPERMLDKIEERVIRADDAVMNQLILGQFEDAPDEAFSTILGNLSPASRAAGWLALERYRPAVDQARREDFLEKALADARQVEELNQRIRLFGRIADRWLERGDLEKARPILLDGCGALADSPPNQWLHEAETFAEALAVVDLLAAIALFERRGKTNVSPPDAGAIDRHKAGAAIRIARFRPDEAEALMPPPSPQFHDRPAAILAAARRMAHVDLERARRLLESVALETGPTAPAARDFVSFGLGALADELAEADPARARALLDEAFTGLREIASDQPNGRGPTSISSLMAELLPVVERVDPDRIAERVWMLAASRRPTSRERNAASLQEASATAARVARYDRAIADVLVDPVLERFLSTAREAGPNQVSPIARNLTVYDPGAIQRLLQALPDSARKPQIRGNDWTVASVEDQLRLAAAQILSVPPEARPAEIGAFTSRRWPYLATE